MTELIPTSKIPVVEACVVTRSEDKINSVIDCKLSERPTCCGQFRRRTFYTTKDRDDKAPEP